MQKTCILKIVLRILILSCASVLSVNLNAQVTHPKASVPCNLAGGGCPSDDDIYSALPFSCNPQLTSYCNLVANNSFVRIPIDPNNPNDPNYYYSPFVKYIDYWTSSHGTPQLNNSLPLIAPNVNHASMWASAQIDQNNNLLRLGEGIAIGIPKLTTNSTYSLSLLKRFYSVGSSAAPDIDDFYVVLLKCAQFQALRRFGEDYIVPDIPSTGAQVIYYESNVNNINFQNITQSFVANDEYDVLWIFPRNNTTTATGGTLMSWLEVALPEIKNVSLCVPPPCTTPTITPAGPIDYYTILDNAAIGITLSASTFLGNQWYLNGSPISGETGPTLTIGNVPPYLPSGSYYVKNNGCQSNTVVINFFMYGYGSYGEQPYILGSKSYPVFTPGFFCPYTTNNPIKQFNLGTNATYKWNIYTIPGGTSNVSIAPGSSSPNSYQAQVNVSGPSNTNPPVGGAIQAVADLNGMQKIIDFQYIIYPDSRSISVCTNSIVEWPMHHYYYWMIKPGGSGFDWEDYDFGPNATIIYPTDPSLFVSPYKLHIPGGNQIAQNIKVKFSAASIVKMDFYDNNNFGGCYKDYVNVSILPGCFAGGNNPISQSLSTIYPNPALNKINIVSTEAIIKEVELFGLFNNSLLKKYGNNSKNLNVNISGLQPGIYNCKITTNKGVEYQKLIIKR